MKRRPTWHCSTALAPVMCIVWLAGCGGSSVEVGVPPDLNGPVVSGQVLMPNGEVAAARSALGRLAQAAMARVEALVPADDNVFPVGAGVEVRLVQIDDRNIVDGEIRNGRVLFEAITDKDGQYAVRLPSGSNASACRFYLEVGNSSDRTLTRAFVFASEPARTTVNFESEATVRLLLDQIGAGNTTLCSLSAADIQLVDNAVMNAPGEVFGNSVSALNSSAAFVAAEDPGVQNAIAVAIGAITPAPTATNTSAPPATASATASTTTSAPPATASTTATAAPPTATGGVPTATSTRGARTATSTPTNTTGAVTRTATSTPTNTAELASPTTTPTSSTAGPTSTGTPTNTGGPTNTVAPTNTATVGTTATNTVALTATAAPTSTAVSTNTAAASATATPVPTNTTAPTVQVTPTVTPIATVPEVNLGVVAGTAGGVVSLPVTLVTNGGTIAAASNDIEYDAAEADVIALAGVPDCTIDTRLTGVKQVIADVTALTGTRKRLRVGVIGTANNTAITGGPLYSCRFALPLGAPAAVTLLNHAEASSPQGNAVSAVGTDGGISVAPAPASLGLGAGPVATDGTVTITASVNGRGQALAAVATDIRFDPDQLAVVDDDENGEPDCTVRPAVAGLGKQLFAAELTGAEESVLRVGLVATTNNTALPETGGAVALFDCGFDVQAASTTIVVQHSPEGAGPAAQAVPLVGEPATISAP